MAGRLEVGVAPDYVVNLSLGEAFEEFILALELAGASRSTIRAYRAALSDFVEFVGRDVTCRDVGSRSFVGWMLTRRREGFRREKTGGRGRGVTLHYYSMFVRRFLEWCGVDVRAPRVPRPRGGVSGVLSWDDIERLIAASRDLLDVVIVSLLAEAGLRSAELLSLRVGDVDLSSGEIRVRRGKYGKSRVVFLGPASRDAVARYIELKGLDANDRLVPLSYQGLYKRLKSLARRAGLPVESVRPHVLRHTFATEALRRGMSLPVLQRLLGHSDIKVTQVYLHLVKEDLRREYERVFVGGERAGLAFVS